MQADKIKNNNNKKYIYIKKITKLQSIAQFYKLEI